MEDLCGICGEPMTDHGLKHTDVSDVQHGFMLNVSFQMHQRQN